MQDIGRRIKVCLIVVAVTLSGSFIMSGCGKMVTTTRVTGSAKPEPVQTHVPEVVSEPPLPVIEETKEIALQEDVNKESPKGVAKPGDKVKVISDIFFDFDRYIIRDESKKALTDNAAIFREKKFKKIVIEGHCDERGTTDYNIALGERRADAAKRYISSLGIDATKVSIISFGREKPFCKEHNEDCWQNNRRAHFVLTE